MGKYIVEVVEVVKLKKSVEVVADSYLEAARRIRERHEKKEIVLSGEDLHRDFGPQDVNFYVKCCGDDYYSRRVKELEEVYTRLGFCEEEIQDKIWDALACEGFDRLHSFKEENLVEELLIQGRSLSEAMGYVYKRTGAGFEGMSDFPDGFGEDNGGEQNCLNTDNVFNEALMKQSMSRYKLAKEIFNYFIYMRRPTLDQQHIVEIPVKDELDELHKVVNYVMKGEVSAYIAVLGKYLHEMLCQEDEFVDHKVEATAQDLYRRLLRIDGKCLRIIKLYTSISGEYIIFCTDAPDTKIEEQLRNNHSGEKNGDIVYDRFELLKHDGFEVNVLDVRDMNYQLNPDMEFNAFEF